MRPPILQPPSYLPAGVLASPIGHIGAFVEHDEVDKVVDLLSEKLAGTQPLGLLGLVKVSKLDPPP